MPQSENQDAPGAGSPPPAAGKPRDAATLIIVDTTLPVPRMLMGRRRPDLVFMPGKFVFPGGRVDTADKDMVSADELDAGEIQKLLAEMKGHPSAARARSLALAAVREAYEETGIIVGSAASGIAAPEHACWQSFAARSYLPRIAPLAFFARAITPPGRPRRFDTRFFCLPADAIAEDTGVVDDELSEIGWYTSDDTRGMDLPPITRVVIEDLADRLRSGPLGPAPVPVPFYHQRHGTFLRDMIEPQT
ncbi:MAG TPA: NUDIX hydrolase [Hyphomicrobiaceae bacterium]|nr:NUDIX hydrolase [Hyphomicrobiaceae bacterium]